MSISVTPEINTQIIISLLKHHKINKIVASPGNTNIALIGSLQNDPYFTIYSSVDERSASYLACGLSEESGEPVVLSCTGATASRNYVPGLTEAYYRKLPVLAITSTQNTARVGHLIAQVIDRSVIQNDIANFSVELPIVNTSEEKWDCEIKANKAFLELSRRGGGPVHINLPTEYKLPFTNEIIPKYKIIERLTLKDDFPNLTGKIAIFIGSHKKFSEEETNIIEEFCEKNNAVVFCDHTSGYYGKYKLHFALVASQDSMSIDTYIPDITIHIGEVSGDYPSLRLAGRQVWRVNEDGEIRDTFKKLRYVFEMEPCDFFAKYKGKENGKNNNHYYDLCNDKLKDIRCNFPDVPFSNIWVASKLSPYLPSNSVVHFGILNSLRAWNLFELPDGVMSNSNVGGFGIDGVLSSCIGASLSSKEKPYFCILGDLAFFYDINSLGNKHIGNNLRILIVNNGKGTEFRNYNHHAAYFSDEIADKYIASAGHFGNKSKSLVKDFSSSLGFEYISAQNKDEFNQKYKKFIDCSVMNKPIVFEIFTDSNEESLALKLAHEIKSDRSQTLKNKAKRILGKEKIQLIKKVIKK